MTQLRKQDVRQHKDGFWTIHITPDAGTVKGATPRIAVVHDHLIEQGFLSFVDAAKPGPLFYDAMRRRKLVEDKTNPPRPQYVQTRQKLADWVRQDVGVKDADVSPNHVGLTPAAVFSTLCVLLRALSSRFLITGSATAKRLGAFYARYLFFWPDDHQHFGSMGR